MNKDYKTPLLLNLLQVLQLTGISEKDKLFQMINDNLFPQHENYGQITFWSYEKIRNWIKENKGRFN